MVRTRACDSASWRALDRQRGADRRIEQPLVDMERGVVGILSAARTAARRCRQRERRGRDVGLVLDLALNAERSAGVAPSQVAQPQIRLRLLQLEFAASRGSAASAACCRTLVAAVREPAGRSCPNIAEGACSMTARSALETAGWHSWAKGPQEERRQLAAALVDELLEPRSVNAQQRHEHRPGREGKDAERHEVDHELLRGNRPHGAGADSRVDLLLQHGEDLRPDGLGRQAGEGRDQLVRPLRVMGQLADDVTGQVRRPRQMVELQIDYPCDLVLERSSQTP